MKSSKWYQNKWENSEKNGGLSREEEQVLWAVHLYCSTFNSAYRKDSDAKVSGRDIPLYLAALEEWRDKSPYKETVSFDKAVRAIQRWQQGKRRYPQKASSVFIEVMNAIAIMVNGHTHTALLKVDPVKRASRG